MLQRMFKVGLAVLVLLTPSCAAMLEEMMADQQELDREIERLRDGGTEPKRPDYNWVPVYTVASDVEGAPIARDFESLCNMITFLAKRDFNSMKAAEARGDVFILDRGTEFVGYKYQGPKKWVIVLTGKHAGKQGWVPFTFVGTQPLRWQELDPTKDVLFKDKKAER